MITIWNFIQFNYCEISGNFDPNRQTGPPVINYLVKIVDLLVLLIQPTNYLSVNFYRILLLASSLTNSQFQCVSLTLPVSQPLPTFSPKIKQTNQLQLHATPPIQLRSQILKQIMKAHTFLYRSVQVAVVERIKIQLIFYQLESHGCPRRPISPRLISVNRRQLYMIGSFRWTWGLLVSLF